MAVPGDGPLLPGGFLEDTLPATHHTSEQYFDQSSQNLAGGGQEGQPIPESLLPPSFHNSVESHIPVAQSEELNSALHESPPPDSASITALPPDIVPPHGPVPTYIQDPPVSHYHFNQHQENQYRQINQDNKFHQAHHYPSAPPSPPPSDYHRNAYYQNAYHQTYKAPSIRYHQEKPEVQVVTQPAPVQTSNIGDAVGMMMMNQMMMQQMQSQQMQAAQMAAMNQQNMNMQAQQLSSQSQNNKGSCNTCEASKQRGTVNIQSSQQKVKTKSRRPTYARAMPIVKPEFVGGILPPMKIQAQEPAPQLMVETVALDNWQEATLILCFAAVGFIYLMCSRGGSEEKKKEDLAKKHMS